MSNSSLSVPAMTIYQALMELSSSREFHRIGYRQLAERSGYCRTTVIHAVRELVQQGWIKKLPEIE